MAFNAFIGLDQATLEQALLDTQKEILTGKSNIGGTLREVSYSKIMTIGPTQRLAMILRALNLLDPEAYPIYDVSIPTRTIATYSGPR